MILNVYVMYFQTKLISSFVFSYLLLLSFLERKWTNFLISQGRFKDLSFGRPLQDLPSHHSYFRFLIIESGHISQLNLQANFFNLTSLIKQTFYEIDWRHNWTNLSLVLCYNCTSDPTWIHLDTFLTLEFSSRKVNGFLLEQFTSATQWKLFCH